MQITSNPYSVLSNASSSSKSSYSSDGQRSKLSDFEGLTDFGSINNTIFQNLLKDPSVQQDVTRGEDGTYSFHYQVADGPLNGHQSLAKTLIAEQNGTTSDEHEGALLSKRDREVFRQATGYNYVQAGGGFSIVDDNGDPPRADQAEMVTAAADAFSTAKEVQKLRGQTGDLTNADLQSMLEWQGGKTGADTKMYDDLMAAIGKSESEGASRVDQTA